MGRTLILLGGLLIAAGLWILYGPRLPWLGRLPGDVVIRKPGFTFYAPLATSLLASVALSLLLWLLRKPG